MSQEPLDDRVGRRLADLEQFAGDAVYTVSLGEQAFLSDSPHGRILRNSGRHVLVQIATVVEKLPLEFTERHPEVDWVAITRMRNLIAHHYDKVDDRLVFTALRVRVPELIRDLGLSAR